NYNLHGKGAIWRIRWKDAPKASRPAVDSVHAMSSLHWPLREAAMRRLASNEVGRDFLRRYQDVNPRMRAAALTALIDVGDKKVALRFLPKRDIEIGIREMAIRVMPRDDVRAFSDAKYPANLRMLALRGLTPRAENDYEDESLLYELTESSDPFLRHEAVRRF